MRRHDRLYFALLNAGHFLDHFFMLIFATAAALALTTEWDITYSALIPYATPGFVAFGLGALPAGWLADRWSRDSMMTLFFHPGPIAQWDDAAKCDTERYARFFWQLIEKGVYFPCSQFEALFISAAHTEDDIERTITAAVEAAQNC